MVLDDRGFWTASRAVRGILENTCIHISFLTFEDLLGTAKYIPLGLLAGELLLMFEESAMRQSDRGDEPQSELERLL